MRRLFPILTLASILTSWFSVQGQNCSVNAGVNLSFCANETVTLYGNKSGLFEGAGNTTWSQVSGPAATIVAPNSLISEVTNVIGGNTYVFRISATCEDNTLVYDDVTYTILPVTQANAGSDQVLCPGSPAGNLNANLGPGETGQWTIIGTNYGLTLASPASPTSSINLSATTSGSVTLRWTITNANGCSSYDEAVITNLGGVTPVSAGPDQVLNNCYSISRSTQLAGSYAGTGINGQIGTWSLVSGPNNPTFNNIHANNATVSNLIEGTYVFLWTVTGPCGTGFDYVEIIVPPPAGAVTSANGGGNQTFCFPVSQVVLNGNPPLYANETVLWTQTLGPAGPVITDPTSPVSSVTGLDGSSSYNFTYSISNSLTGCSSSNTVQIRYRTGPTIVAGPDQILPCDVTIASITYSQSGTGTVQYSIISGPPGAFNYPTSWANTGNSPFNLNLAPVPASYKPGTFLVRLRKSSGTGTQCSTAFDDIYITTSKAPTASNAGTDQILACNIFQTQLAGNFPVNGNGTWSQVFGPNTAVFSNINDPNSTISGLTNGIYRFRWLISGGLACNPSQDDVNVIVANLIPSVAAAGPDSTICHSTPYQLSGNKPTYKSEKGTWTVVPSTGITFVPNSNAHNATVLGMAANTSYTFTWTIANPCGSTSDDCTVTTSESAGPVASNAGGDECFPTGTTSTNLDGNDPSPGTGQWSQLSGPACTITDPSLRNTSVTGMTDGNYEFEWAIQTASCAGVVTRDTVLITISAPVTPANAGTDQEICGTSATLTGNIPVLYTDLVWRQIAGPGGAVITDSLATTTTVTGLVNGVYTFRYFIFNGACAGSYDDVRLYVTNPPTPAIAGPDQDLCNATSTVMAANTILSGTGVWSVIAGPVTPTIANVLSPITTVSGMTVPGQYIFTWSSFSGPYCPASEDTVIITVEINANAGADQNLCDVTETQLTGNANSTGTWSFISGPGPIPVITPIGINSAGVSGMTSPGAYVFQYAISNYPWCPSSDQVTVNVYGAPTEADAGEDTSYCNVGWFTLEGNTPVVGTGQWVLVQTVPSGMTVSYADNSNDPTPVVTITSANKIGTFVFEWRITSGTNCSSRDQVTVVNHALPSVANAGADLTLVCDSTATMAANTPSAGLGEWIQVSGPQQAIILAPASPNTEIRNLRGAGAGPWIYEFEWVISSGPCEPSRDTLVVTVYDTPTEAEAGPDVELCNQLYYTMAATPVSNGLGSWSHLNGPSAIINDPSSPTTGITLSGGAGSYEFLWTSSLPPCESLDTVVITNYAEPTVAFAGPDQNLCLYSPVFMDANTVLSGTGAWSQFSGPGNVVFLQPDSPMTQVIGVLAGTYEFVWTISNGTCTPSSDTVTIIMNDLPTLAVAGPDQVHCNTDSIQVGGSLPMVGTGTWSQVAGPGGVNIVSPNNNITDILDLLPGYSYQFRWEIANSICISEDTMNVVNIATPEPPVNLTVDRDCFCSSDPGNITLEATGGSGATLRWYRNSCGGTLVGTGPTIVIPSPTTTTTYYARWEAPPCDPSDCISITVVVDQSGPTFSTCPPDTILLGCNANPTKADALAAAGDILDNCDGDPTVVVDSASFEGCEYVRTFTITATDQCNNSSQCVVDYKWTQDTEPPVFVDCPDTVDLGCNPGPIKPFQAIEAAGTITDNCSVETVVADFGTITGGCLMFQEWTVTATDKCGNSSQCFITFRFGNDIEDPVFTACPDTIDLGCNPESVTESQAITDAGPVTDNCSVQTISALGGLVLGECRKSQIWTVTAIDTCGNTAQCEITYIWADDQEDPVFTACPDTIDLGCNPDPVTEAKAIADAGAVTDNCSVESISASGEQVIGDCLKSQVWTVTATDTCGNIAQCEMTYTWADDQSNPFFIACPDTIDLGCNPDPVTEAQAISDAGQVDDNCSVESVSGIGGNITGDCVKTQVWTVTALDTCDNSAQCVITYIWADDQEDPVFTAYPDTIDLGCNPDPVTEAKAISDAGAVTDNCSVESISGLGGNITGECVKVQTWTVTAVDTCGNSAQCLITYIWADDQEDPVFTACPDTIDLGCNPDPVTEAQAIADAGAITDNCSVESISGLGGTVTGECVRTQTWTVTAIDTCGNTAQCEITYLWADDQEDPVFSSCPDTVDLGCNPPPVTESQAISDAGTVTDNCAIISIAGEGDEILGECVKTQLWTITATDTCGNTAQCLITYLWADSPLDPVFLECPETIDLGCNPEELPNPEMALEDAGTVVVNCGVPYLITQASAVTGTCEKSQVWTVTAVDTCGNDAVCEFMYTWIEDTIPPDMVCPPGQILLSLDDLPPYFTSFTEYISAGGTALDNCTLDEDSFIFIGADTVENTSIFVTRTYAIADICGNRDTCEHYFEIIQYEYGDAPEGKIAYPKLGILGSFPTCLDSTISGFIRHKGISPAWFGPMVDLDADGNGGLCSPFKAPYDNDECGSDGDAGLIVPAPYSISNNAYIGCNAPGTPFTIAGDTVYWGQEIDIFVTNISDQVVYFNLLIDWNHNGRWDYDPTTKAWGHIIPEHRVVNQPVPPGFTGPLSQLNLPPFYAGPRYGYVWTRFSLTEVPVVDNWDGSGDFELGETEDYLFYVQPRTQVPLSDWALALGIALIAIFTLIRLRKR